MSSPQASSLSASSASSVSLYDARPFFEKALQHGVRHGIIDAARLESIQTDAPKGMVQIARYFGSEFLRPELEKARERMVNLVSLYLEESTAGDLQRAAESLRDHSFLSRSKGGSDMLKALIAMPQNSHFGMSERRGFSDEHIPLLAKWTLRSLADYQAELAKRRQVAHTLEAAISLAGQLGMDEADLEEEGKDAEAVIRTALLVLSTGGKRMPDWVAFEKMIVSLRKKYGPASSAGGAPAIVLPSRLPADQLAVVQAVQQSMAGDFARMLDGKLATRQLFDQTPAFMGRYFWIDDGLNEVDHHDREVSDAWNKATGGNADDGSLLTLFVCLAAGSPPKTLWTEKAATALVRKIQKTGLKPEVTRQFIAEHAPVQHQGDCLALWNDFLEEAQEILESDASYALADAVALLRRECHVK
jgi:hypothetical protein